MNSLNPRAHAARICKAWLVPIVAFVLAGGILAGLPAEPARATSHFDGPVQAINHRTNATDLWAFTSPDRPDTVTLIATYTCCQAFVSPQNDFIDVPFSRMWFAKNAYYDLNIDSTGDGKPEMTFRWKFNGGQAAPESYEVQERRPGREPRILTSDAALLKHPSNIPGPLDFDGYRRLRAKSVVKTPDGISVWAGKARDPFYFDYRMFGLMTGALPLQLLPPVDVTGTFSDTNIIAIQVPKKYVALHGDLGRNPVIGAWTSAYRETLDMGKGSKYVQVSRAGNPSFLIFNSISMQEKWNTMSPDEDHKTPGVLDGVYDPVAKGYPAFKLAKVAADIFGYKVPPAPRRDTEGAYLTGIAKGEVFKEDLNTHTLNRDADRKAIVPAEEMRLNMTTPLTQKPDRFGYLEGDRQGWPNGRRLIDDATTMTFGAVMTGDLMYGRQLTKNVFNIFWKTGLVRPLPGHYSDEFPYVPTPTGLPKL